MPRERHPVQFVLARVWAYPLWVVALHSKSAPSIREDVDWWMRCIDDDRLSSLDEYTRFAFLAGALKEFRTLLHYRLRAVPFGLRVALRLLYRPEGSLTLDAGRIGPGLFIQHGFATIVVAESIGSHCWINQQVTVGHRGKGKPTLGDNVRIGAGAVVVGGITLHDGATVGANATVFADVAPGDTVVAPQAIPLKKRDPGDVEPA